MARRVSGPRIAVALLLLPALPLVAFQGCATLPTVDGNTCGDGLRAEEEQCDLPDGGNKDTGFCGKAGTEHACLWVVAPEGDPECRPERIKDGERCLVASGVFGAEESLPGLYPVASGDFDGDGQVDLVHDGVSGRAVTFFDNGSPVDPAVVVGRPSFLDRAAIDVDLDGRTDLLVPTTARDGIGVLAGQANRGFAARFQSSVSLPAGARRLVALPPEPRDGAFDLGDRALRQLGLLYEKGSKTQLCTVGLDGTCEDLSILGSALQSLPPAAIVKSIITTPYFIEEGIGAGSYVTAFAAYGGSQIALLRTTTDNTSISGSGMSTEIFASGNAQLKCNRTCGDAPCACLTTSAHQVHALKVVEPSIGLALGAAVSFTQDNARYLGLYYRELTQAATELKPFVSLDRAVPLSGEVLRVEIGDLDDNPESTEFVISQRVDGATTTKILFTGAQSTEVDGPNGNFTVGDINGDGFDDVVGADSLSTAGGVIYFGGDDLPLTKAPLVIDGFNPDFYLADLDGNGIKDIVITTTLEAKPAPENFQRSLVIHFGRPFTLPAQPVQLGASTNQQVLPLTLQVKSFVDLFGETAVTDGIEDLVVLESDNTASFVTGDVNGYPLSPYFLTKPIRDLLALPDTEVALLVSTVALARPTGPDGKPVPPKPDAPIALLTFLKFSAEGSFVGSSIVPLFTQSGKLTLNPNLPGVSTKAIDLDGFFPASDAVFYDAAHSKFGLFTIHFERELDRRAVIFTIEDGTLSLVDSAEVKGFLTSDNQTIEPKLITGSLPPLAEDSTLWLMAMEGEGTATLTQLLTASPTGLELAATNTTVQWLGPHSAQLGDTVVDFQATLATFANVDTSEWKIVEDTCIKASTSGEDPLLHAAAYYLTGNALPDRVRALPVTIAPQLEGTTCEASESSDPN